MDYNKTKEILKKELQEFDRTNQLNGFFITQLVNDLNENFKINNKEDILSYIGGILKNDFIFKHIFYSIFRPTKKVVKIELSEDTKVVLLQNKGKEKWTDFSNKIVQYVGMEVFRQLGYNAKEYSTFKEIKDNFSYTPIKIEEGIWLCQQNFAGDGRWSSMELVEKLNIFYKYEKFKLNFEDEDNSRTFNRNYKLKL